MSKLTMLYQELVTQARATGRDAAKNLTKGARMAVRIRDGVQTVTFSRFGAPLGEQELTTFVAHCTIPTSARRIPEKLGAQGHMEMVSGIRYYVAYTWTLTEVDQLEQQALILPAAPTPRVRGDTLWPDLD